MKPFLEFLVIEGHDGKRRELKFEAGMNIITGSGSKGKSAVLRIVEYCLGGRSCNIPVGRVRDFGAWYYLVLNVNDQHVTIGRKGPSETGESSEAGYFAEGSAVPHSEAPKLSVGINTACKLLSDALGFPNERFQLGMDPLVHGRLQLPEVLPLLVQPQDIIATQQLFPYVPAADPRSVPERWTQIVKIALKIIRPDLLLLRERERELIKRKESSRRRHSELRARYSDASTRVEHLWHEAVAANFAPLGRFSSLDEIRVGLERMRSMSTSEVESSAASSQTDVKTVELETRSRDLRRSLRQYSQELKQLELLRDASRNANASLNMERSRLRVVDLLGAPTGTDVSCPLCGTDIGTSNEELLATMQHDLDDELMFIASIPPELDSAEEALRRDQQNAKRELSGIETQLDALQRQEPAPTLTQERVQRERLIGALDHAFRVVSEVSSNIDPGGEGAAIDAELSDLKEEIRVMETEKDEWEVREALNSRMVSLAGSLKRMRLDGDSLAFDRRFSTIQRGRAGKMDPLSTLGGAENFVMYHICALLALHEQLSKGGFVPRLLILDQPSQAYFPSKTDASNADIEAVWSIYDLLFRVAAECDNRFQIIVLDHADFSSDDVRFKDSRRHNWHDGEGLILDSGQ